MILIDYLKNNYSVFFKSMPYPIQVFKSCQINQAIKFNLTKIESGTSLNKKQTNYFWIILEPNEQYTISRNEKKAESTN